MSHRIRFTAEGPMSKFDALEEQMIKEGFKVLNLNLHQRGAVGHTKSPPVNGQRKVYKKPAMEIVFEALNGNKGMAMAMDTLSKALDMPKGTLSGSLAKLKKAGRVKNDGKGRWCVLNDQVARQCRRSGSSWAHARRKELATIARNETHPYLPGRDGVAL